jgi:peptidyl-prolyl cis-trans isomerase SurA
MNSVSQLATTALGCAALLVSSGLSAQTRELGSSGKLLDGIAAVVDDGVVLKSEVEEAMQRVEDNFRQQQAQLPAQQKSQLPPESVIQKQVLDQLVMKRLELQRAKKLGITVGDDMLNEAMSRVAQNLGVSLEQLPAALAQKGINYATYRENSRDELIINQLEQRDVLSRISVTPRELQQCLKRQAATETDKFDYNVSDILVSVPLSASSDQIAKAKQKIEDIKSKLDAGSDFAQLALTYSDAQTALKGGSLGWRKGSELPTAFANVVVHLKPKQYAGPIRTASGFHIVRLNDMRGGKPVIVEQLHVRHILISTNEVLDDAAARQKLLGIRKQIVGGDSFATVARAVSEDTVSAADGGDLGWIDPNSHDYVPEFMQVISKLKVGQISQPFKTRYGWHIAEVTGTRQHDMSDEVKRQHCQQEVRASKAQEQREIWAQQMRDQAYVDLRM